MQKNTKGVLLSEYQRAKIEARRADVGGGVLGAEQLSHHSGLRSAVSPSQSPRLDGFAVI